MTHPGLAAALILLDRASKAWAQEWLLPRGSAPLLPFLHLTYVENTGAAWGMMRGANGLLIGVSIALTAGLLWLRRSWPRENGWLQFGSTMVASGAVGNLYDRVRLGYVVDFIDFRVWPVFNVADSAITLGAVALAWGMHLEDRKAALK